ncbi:MAG: transcriptional regulator with sensor, AraC family [Chthoniobacteraceae bacterium]|nr:transcriptional regulator with sensor, AraC family [Chthoniobacteraceae bacterium]
MAISPGSVARMGFASEEEIIGRSVHDYLPADLADKYIADDQWVLKNGKPLLNVLEIFFNAQGLRDWMVTNKYPLKNRLGEVIGLIGTMHGFEARRKQLAHLGPVGKAADFIRENLGNSMSLAAIARYAALSERQLQRLFKSIFGMTIQEFIIQSRIQGAIRELTHSDRALSDIAFKFGFSDQSAFSNRFRKITGLTPRAYRLRYSGGTGS